MEGSETIYVALLEEGVEVFRPVQAQLLRDHVYRILQQPYDRTLEHWAFEPGETVVCRMTMSSDHVPFMLAFKRFEPGAD